MELYAFSNVFMVKFSENDFKYSSLHPPNGGPTSVKGKSNSKPDIFPFVFKSSYIFETYLVLKSGFNAQKNVCSIIKSKDSFNSKKSPWIRLFVK